MKMISRIRILRKPERLERKVWRFRQENENICALLPLPIRWGEGWGEGEIAEIACGKLVGLVFTITLT
jgi:hypothetical protein